MIDAVRIRNDDWEILIDAEQGATFQTCRYKGFDVFRKAELSEGLDGFIPFQTGHFALHPFSNRIAGGQFQFRGQSVNLKNKIPGEPYPLHGFGLIKPWKIFEKNSDSCSLVQRVKDDDWLWEYEAVHSIKISGNTLRLGLKVSNKSHDEMPCGFGFHPYFPNLGSAFLEFESDGVWLCGKNLIPTQWVRSTGDYNFSEARQLNEVKLDHCFTGVGAARLSWTDSPLTIGINSSKNLRRAAVFTDHSSDSFCFEPVSHTHNALNMDSPVEEGIKVLSPGETISCWSEYSVCINAVISCDS